MTQTTWHDFAHYLKRTRLRAGLSQEQLAEQLGVSRIHIWRLEHGTRRPSKLLLRAIAAHLPPSQSGAQLMSAFEGLLEYDCDHLEIARL
jgi:transcriptional regulator with XRE-family HTH domain